MKQITALVFAVLIGIAIGAGMGTPSAQQPCASPSPTTVGPSTDATTNTLTLTSSDMSWSSAGSGTITLVSPSDKCVEAEFEPMQDITAYELAKLLPYIDPTGCMTECEWKELGTITRHLKRTTKEPGQ